MDEVFHVCIVINKNITVLQAGMAGSLPNAARKHKEVSHN